MSTFKVLGDKSPIPCDIGDADSFAWAFLERGTKVDPFPFCQPFLDDKEVRIKVTHAGLCHSDIMRPTGSWGENILFPMVPGHEIIGTVEKVGEKVTHLQEGDYVGFGPFRDCCDSCSYCRKGRDNLCLESKETDDPWFGGFSTSFQARGDFYFKLHESIPGEYAPLFCAGATVYPPLMYYAQPTMKVGIVGIGGLGHMAIKFANKFGCEVTAISKTSHKEPEARKFGAHHFLDLNDAEKVKRAGKSFDLIIDTSVIVDLEMDFNLLKNRSKCCLVGCPDIKHDHKLNMMQLLMNQQELAGNFVGSRQEIEDMLEFARFNEISPQVEVYKFEDMQKAINSLAYGNPRPPRFRNVVETASFFQCFKPKMRDT
jgi:uncharacterized zinc-type alcohol dehydrogenase-like protein